MPTIDQYLRALARSQPNTPFWVLEKDYALGYLLSGMAQMSALGEAALAGEGVVSV